MVGPAERTSDRPGVVAGSDPEPEVELRHLRHFLSVAEELHFGRAATRLFISQPALSQSIAKLERTLEVQLLDRSPHGVQLTEAGLELVNYARRLLVDTQNAVERVRTVGRGQAGMLRTGVALLAEHLIAPALAALHDRYPGIVLDGTAAVSERLLVQLSEGRLQVAFVHQVPALTALAQVQWELVRRGRLAVMMSRQHPLAGRDLIALRQLAGETFLVNPRELAPSAYQGLKLMCAEFGGFDPRVTESAAASAPALDPDWRPVRQCAAIAIMAEEIARAICPPDIAVVPVRPPPRSAIAVAWRQGDHCALVDRVLSFIRAYRDNHGWLADSAGLSPAHKHLLDGPGGRPVSLSCQSLERKIQAIQRNALRQLPTVSNGERENGRARKSSRQRPVGPLMAEFPAPTEGLLLTYLVVSRDVARSHRFYTEVLGGETVLDTDGFAIVAIANGWVTITSPGAPTPDKPDVTLEAPSDLDRVSGFMNVRVADIGAAYDQWRARGARFLTPPIDHGGEIRCYMRDPDGHLIEVGQVLTRPGR